ncbi:MAG: FxLYD domain-containing protein [Salinirussus sp.]
MATAALSVGELFISVAFSSVIGVVWGILGYYRARGQGEAFSWNKLAQSVVIAGAAGAGFYLINRELPSEQDLLLIAPAIIGITASAEKATRSVQAQAAGTYIPYTEPRVLFFNTDLYVNPESAGVLGYVRNNTGKRLPRLKLTATFYDDDWSALKRTERFYDGLAAFDRWKFDVVYEGENPEAVAGYNLEAVVIQETKSSPREQDGATIQQPGAE